MWTFPLSQDFPARLADVLRAAYAEVFQYRDPAKDTPDELREVFRFYRPPSMQDRMLRLFYGLCEAAGIVEEAPTIAQSGGNGSAPRAKTKPSKSPKPSGDKPPPPPPPPPRNEKLPDLVAALVKQLPADGESMTAEDAAWWFDTAKLVFPRAYKYEPRKEAD